MINNNILHIGNKLDSLYNHICVDSNTYLFTFIVFRTINRYEEYLADIFACKTRSAYSEYSLALIKGYKKYERLPSSHFLYSFVYHKHPTLESRLKYCK